MQEIKKYLLEYLKEWITRKPRMRIVEAISSFSLWLKSVRCKKQAVDLELPWVTVPVIKFLNKSLKPGTQVAEFGVGGSTLFFLKKNLKLVSIEHNRKYFSEIKHKVYQKNLEKNWTGLVIPPNKIKNEKKSYEDPKNYLSSENTTLSFKKYVKAIDNYSNDFFDLIIIDGRARPSCILHSAKKVKINGFLIVDNADSTYYFSDKKIKTILNNFELCYDSFAPCILINYFIQTKIFQRIR